MSLTPLEVPAYLSPSSIETFQICPLKYKLSRIDHLSDPPTEATVLGNYVHDALEELLKLDPLERTESAAKSILSRIWTEPVDPSNPEAVSWGEQASRLIPTEEDMRKFRWRAWWCVENYFKMEDPQQVEYGGLETSLAYPETGELVRVDGVPVKGFVDRWDYDGDGFNIVDYKSGKSPQPRYQQKKFQQLLIYATAMQTLLDMEPHHMSLMYVKDALTLTQEVTPVAIRKTEMMVSGTYSKIEQYCAAGEFPAVTNPLCNWCSYKSICPAWK